MEFRTIIIICFLIQTITCFSQQKKPVTSISKPISADCKKAIPILLKSSTTYGPTLPPKGFGDLQEFKTNNSLTFEGEHNSAWYLLSIAKDGELVFDIVPQDTTNDYDFLLYSYTDSTFCDALHKNKLKPVRSNLSNIKKSVKGITGLKKNTVKNTIGEGIGAAYSKSIDVKKGEKYMLILDNITPEGKGHTLFFNFVKEVEINGKVINSDSIPVVADITLSDSKGNIIAETSSDKNGNYAIKTTIIENQNYNFTTSSDSEFVQTKTINTKDLKGKNTFTDLKIVLPKLKKGGKYKFDNLNFYGNAAEILPESIPSLEALYKLMKKNKNMSIQIEGHVNADTFFSGKPSKSTLMMYQTLSEARAMTVYNYLVTKNITKERMTTIGYGGTRMLFPNPKNEQESTANRRVEIKVISIE